MVQADKKNPIVLTSKKTIADDWPFFWFLNYISDVEPETFDHILNDCPCFQQARFDILHNQPIINTLNWDSADIIAFSHLPTIDEALTFE